MAITFETTLIVGKKINFAKPNKCRIFANRKTAIYETHTDN